MKNKYFISILDEKRNHALKIIEGEEKIIELDGWEKPLKIIIHKNEDNLFVATEYKTGFSIFKSKRKDDITGYWLIDQIKKIGEEKFNKTIEKTLATYGTANE